MTRTDLIRYAITFAVIGIILLLRLRRMNQARKLRLETLWIIPAIYTAFAAMLFWRMPPIGTGWIWSVIALLLGAALGWQRGRMMTITVDPETHELNQRSSPGAFLFILLLIGVRLAMRSTVVSSGAHISAALVTDILVASAVGLLAANRLELFLRARRLLGEVRGY